MKIVGFIWWPEIIEKLYVKHRVVEDEVEQAFANEPKTRFMEKGIVWEKICTLLLVSLMLDGILQFFSFINIPNMR